MMLVSEGNGEDYGGMGGGGNTNRSFTTKLYASESQEWDCEGCDAGDDFADDHGLVRIRRDEFIA